MNKLIISILLMVGLVGMIGTVAAEDPVDPVVYGTITDGSSNPMIGYQVKFYEMDVGGTYQLQTPIALSSGDISGQPDAYTHEWISPNLYVKTDANGKYGIAWLSQYALYPWGSNDLSAGAGNPGNYRIDLLDPTGTTVLRSVFVDMTDPNAWDADPAPNLQIDVVYSTNQDFDIPEFQTIALPIAAVLGLMFIISSRKKKE